MTKKVFINGYGTIGKRIADAILKQPDMQLLGIGKRTPDYKALIANRKNIPIYVPTENDIRIFEERGIKVAGIIEDAISQADIIIDTSPGGKGALNKELYIKYDKPAIFQGGEKANIADVSFVAQVNYREALGKKYVRVVSCNTTGMSRILHAISSVAKIKSVRGVLVRRAADPWETKKGPINAIVPSLKLPSHHAPDVKTVLGDIDIYTVAVVVPTTIMHIHILNVSLETKISEDDIIGLFEEAPRILVFNADYKFDSTASIIEFARDLGRERNDLYEVAVFDRGVKVEGNNLWLIYAVHQEAIVVPENIDAIRASLQLETDPSKSIRLTDETLGVISRL